MPLRGQPFEELNSSLGTVHTLFIAPALVSNELIKVVQLLYSVRIIHACCSPQTGIAFSSRLQEGNPADPNRFRRIRSAPLGWASPGVTVGVEEISTTEESSAIEFHADGDPGRGGGSSPLILAVTSKPRDSVQRCNGKSELRLSSNDVRKPGEHAAEGEVVIKGLCVSIGYYRHQTAFQQQLTSGGSYRTGLVAMEVGPGYPPLITNALSRNVLTAEGEFIDLEEAEHQIRNVPIVRRVFLYADNFVSPLVAIVQPRKASILSWAKRRFAFSDDYGESYERLLSLPALREFVLQQIKEHTWLALETFEIPKAIYLVPHDVTLPLGLLGGEKKPQPDSRIFSRRQLADVYVKPIREMYTALAE